jgi:inorganic pyrophosphatase
MKHAFWDYLQKLVDGSRIVIDRPKGSTHPRYGTAPYPASYGYLEGTTAIDGGGVDIWVGSMRAQKIVGVLCTVDLKKRDTELKIILDCTQDEIQQIVDFVNIGEMRGFYLHKE